MQDYDGDYDPLPSHDQTLTDTENDPDKEQLQSDW